MSLDMSLDTHFLYCMSLCMSLDTHFLYRHCHLDQRDGNAVGLTGLL